MPRLWVVLFFTIFVVLCPSLDHSKRLYLSHGCKMRPNTLRRSWRNWCSNSKRRCSSLSILSPTLLDSFGTLPPQVVGVVIWDFAIVFRCKVPPCQSKSGTNYIGNLQRKTLLLAFLAIWARTWVKINQIHRYNLLRWPLEPLFAGDAQRSPVNLPFSSSTPIGRLSSSSDECRKRCLQRIHQRLQEPIQLAGGYCYSTTLASIIWYMPIVRLVKHFILILMLVTRLTFYYNTMSVWVVLRWLSWIAVCLYHGLCVLWLWLHLTYTLSKLQFGFLPMTCFFRRRFKCKNKVNTAHIVIKLPSTGFWEADLGNVRFGCHHTKRLPQRFPGDAKSLQAEPTLITYNLTISACEKVQEWQTATCLSLQKVDQWPQSAQDSVSKHSIIITYHNLS